MRFIGFPVALLCLSAVSSAQYLRTSAYANVSTSAGNNFQLNEQAWLLSSSGSSLTRTANAVTGGGNAATSFTAEFGNLRGSTHALLNTSGVASATSSGLFSSFNSFVGSSFDDTLTLTGTGVVSLTINYSLHTVNRDSNDLTFAQTLLKMDTYSSTIAGSHPVALEHVGSGENSSSGSITVSGVAGNKFDLIGEMSSLSSIFYAEGDSGLNIADSDATHTASVWISATSGGFTSASGSSYLEPVPEPASLSVIGLGVIALLRRRKLSA